MAHSFQTSTLESIVRDDTRKVIDNSQFFHYPKWPHEYIVRKNVDEKLFVQFVKFIRTNGYEGNFYMKKLTYLEHNDKVYWTMGAPIEEKIIINRCGKENTFDHRLKERTWPN